MQDNPIQALLAVLGTEATDAGTAYRELHVRLVRFFRLLSDGDAESLADEALDRLSQIAARSDACNAPPIASATALALGIARHILQEDRRRQIRETRTAREWMSSRVQSNAQENEILDAISACLGTMPESKRDLLTTYYEWRGKRKIEHHRLLAEKLGLTANALRNRLMRARGDLDACVRKRLRDDSKTIYTNSGSPRK